MYEIIDEQGNIIHTTSNWAVAQIILAGRFFGAFAILDYS